MTKRVLAASYILGGLLCASASSTQAADILSAAPGFKDDLRPSVYVVELGGFGVFEPSYEGSKRYLLSFKPIVDINKEGDRVWQFFPNDAIGYDLFETDNFHAGPAANLSLQSRFHNPDIDFQFGIGTQDDKAADALSKQINGMLPIVRGMVGANAKNDPNAGVALEVMKTLQASQQGAVVIVRGVITEAVLDEAAKNSGKSNPKLQRPNQ